MWDEQRFRTHAVILVTLMFAHWKLMLHSALHTRMIRRRNEEFLTIEKASLPLFPSRRKSGTA